MTCISLDSRSGNQTGQEILAIKAADDIAYKKPGKIKRMRLHLYWYYYRAPEKRPKNHIIIQKSWCIYSNMTMENPSFTDNCPIHTSICCWDFPASHSWFPSNHDSTVIYQYIMVLSPLDPHQVALKCSLTPLNQTGNTCRGAPGLVAEPGGSGVIYGGFSMPSFVFCFFFLGGGW